MIKHVSIVYVDANIDEDQMTTAATLPKPPASFTKLYQAMERVILKRPPRTRGQLKMLQNEKFDCWLRETKEDFLSLRVLYLRALCEILKYTPLCFKYSESETFDSVFSTSKFITLSTIDYPDNRTFFKELLTTQHFIDWIMKCYYYLVPTNPNRRQWAEKGDTSFIKSLLRCYSASLPVTLSEDIPNLRDEIFAGDFSLHSFNKHNKLDMDDILEAQPSSDLVTDLIPEYVLYRGISSKKLSHSLASRHKGHSVFSTSPRNLPRFSRRFSSFSLHSPKAVQQQLIDITDFPDQALVFDLSTMRNFLSSVNSPAYSQSSEHHFDPSYLSEIIEVEQSAPVSPLNPEDIAEECHELASII